jgi:hypothetical protein
MVAGRSATKNKIPSTEIQVIRERRRVVSSWGRIQLLILLHVSPMMTCCSFSTRKRHGFRPRTTDFSHILRLALFAWNDGISTRIWR